MCVVEIQTDDGLVGTGWCEDYARATSVIIENHLTKILVGADPRERSRLWDQMFRSTMPYGRKGPALYAISAVDIALWDLAGKHFGQPVYELLGGPGPRPGPRLRQPPPLHQHRRVHRGGGRVRAPGLQGNEDALPARARRRAPGHAAQPSSW